MITHITNNSIILFFSLVFFPFLFFSIISSYFEFTITPFSGYDLCEACFSQVGRLHQHKMKRYRKTPVPQLIELTENVINVLQERDEVYSREPIREASPVPEIPREALEQTVYATRSETNSKRKKREAKLKEEVQQPSDNYDSEVIDCICGNNKDLGSN